jgi:hypothetical protein
MSGHKFMPVLVLDDAENVVFEMLLSGEKLNGTCGECVAAQLPTGFVANSMPTPTLLSAICQVFTVCKPKFVCAGCIATRST